MTRYRISHRTTYRYDEAVAISINDARLGIRADQFQNVFESNVTIEPEPTDRHDYVDWFGNTVTHFSIEQSHHVLDVLAVSDVEVVRVPVLDDPGPAVGDVIEQVGSMLDVDGMAAREARLDSPLLRALDDVDGLAEWLGDTLRPDRGVLDAVRELNHRIFDEFEYDPTATSVATPLQDVVDNKAGVCQDFAHVAIAACRSVGLPARYVSGYLETVPPPGTVKLRGADASHAWFSVFVPGVGWADFDPTNDVQPESRHIVAAVGRDYSDVVPVKGVIVAGGGTTLEVAVDVEPQLPVT